MLTASPPLLASVAMPVFWRESETLNLVVLTAMLFVPLLGMLWFLALDRPFRSVPGKSLQTSGNSWFGWRWMQYSDGTVHWCGPWRAQELRNQALEAYVDPLQEWSESLDTIGADLSVDRNPPAPSLRASLLTFATLSASALLACVAGPASWIYSLDWSQESLRYDWGPVFVLYGVVIFAVLPWFCLLVWFFQLAFMALLGQCASWGARILNTGTVELRGARLQWRDRGISLGQAQQDTRITWDLGGPVLQVRNATQTLRVRGRQSRLIALLRRLETIDVAGSAEEVPEPLRALKSKVADG